MGMINYRAVFETPEYIVLGGIASGVMYGVMKGDYRVAAIAGGVSIAMATGLYVTHKTTAIVHKLEQQTHDLKEKNTELRKKSGELDDRIAGLNDRIAGLGTRIDSLE